MEEIPKVIGGETSTLPKKRLTSKEYYKLNKIHYKKGGKYYNYTPKADRISNTKFEVNRGVYLLSFS